MSVEKLVPSLKIWVTNKHKLIQINVKNASLQKGTDFIISTAFMSFQIDEKFISFQPVYTLEKTWKIVHC